MKITREEFEFKHHSFEKAKIIGYKEYVYHDLDAWNKIIIDDVEFYAFYQTGLYYEYDNYNCPTNDLSLSDCNTSKELLIIDKLYEDDIFNNTEDAQEALEELIEMGSNIDTLDKMLEVKEFLNDNRPYSAIDFIDDLGHSDDIKNYNEDEDGFLTLI